MNEKNVLKTGVIAGVSYLTLLQVIRMIINLALAAVLLRYLGPSNKGILAIALSILGIISLSRIQTGQALQTFIPKLIKDGDAQLSHSLIWQSYIIRVIIIIIISIILFITESLITDFYNIPKLGVLLHVLVITNLITVASGPIDHHSLIAFKEFRAIFIIGLLELLGLVAAVTVTVSFKLNLEGYLWCVGISPLFSFIYGWINYYILFRRYSWNFISKEIVGSKEWFSRLLRFSLPTSISGILFQLSQYIGILITGKYFSTSIVGLYSFAVGIVNKIWVVISLPETVFTPQFAEAAHNNKKQLSSLLTTLWGGMLFYGTAASLVIIAFPFEITNLLAGNEFIDSIPMLQLFGFQFVFRALSSTRLIYYAIEQPAGILKRQLIKFILEILGLFILIPAFGIMGIIGANILSYLAWGLIISFGAYGHVYINKREKYIAYFRTWMIILFIAGLLLLYYFIQGFITMVGIPLLTVKIIIIVFFLYIFVNIIFRRRVLSDVILFFKEQRISK